MTDSDFKFLEKIYREAKRLKKLVDDCPGDSEHFLQYKIEFDEFDVIDQLVNNTSQRVKLFDEKINNIRSYVLRKSNGIVDLPKEVIIGIIEKSVL